MATYSHFKKLCGVEGLYVGAAGYEKSVVDALGRIYLNFEPGSQFFVDSATGSATNGRW